MALAPRSAPDSVTAILVPDAAEVREQLERLLVHPLFANSKRYPALLAYAVDQTGDGHGVLLAGDLHGGGAAEQSVRAVKHETDKPKPDGDSDWAAAEMDNGRVTGDDSQ